MTDEKRWRRVQEIFDQAVVLDGEARRAVIDEACADDEALREEVESLLASSLDATTDFLSPPRALEVDGELVATDPHLGERLGPWRLVRRLGEGGMGVVYLGERADGEFGQRVAIKLVRAPWVAPSLLPRFRTERQILARLEHPNIARLFDGGTTEVGLPYLVMEYVEGDPITDLCAARGLSTRQRLALFLEVCAAVSHAHRHLVVHRDLKPGNILVTPDGTPKLLDFGIAKLLAKDEDAPTVALTALHGRLLTPEYASPEQVRGEPVSTASDVYALGILLYELLTGEPPYRFETPTPREIERVVCEQAPTRPSTAVGRVTAGRTADDGMRAASGRADVPPSRLRRELAGDLDVIVLTALRKEPERRYPSVERLAEDVRRHLDQLPIAARPDTWSYRARKFAQRHRAGVTVAAGLLLLVLAFAASMAALAARLAAERDRATAAEEAARSEAVTARRATDFLAGVFEGANPFGAGGPELTARAVVEHGAERIQSELAGEPEVRATLLDTMGGVYGSLGDYDRAEELLREALAVRRDLFGHEHPETAATMDSLAEVLRKRGDLEAAEPLYRKALLVRLRELGQEDPAVAESLNNFGLLLKAAGRRTEAERYFLRALEIRREALGEDHPLVAVSLSNLALLRRIEGRYEEAASRYREVLERRERTLGPSHPLVANSLQGLGQSLQALGRFGEAGPLLRRCLEIRRRALGAEHPLVARSLNDLAALLQDEGRLAEAEPLYRETMTLQERLYGAESADVAVVTNNLATLLEDRGRLGEAEALFRRSLAIRRSVYGDEHPAVARATHNLARLLAARGAVADSEDLFRGALEQRRKLLRPGHPEIAGTLVSLGSLLVEQGEAREAEPLLREGLAIRREALGPDHWQTGEAESAVGRCLLALGRADEAEPLLRSGHAILLRERGADHALTQMAAARLRGS